MPGVATYVIAAVIATCLTAAPVTTTAAAAVSCPTETVDFGAGKSTLRFVLRGNATCSEAHRTLRAYARAVAAGRCPTRICTQVTFPGGWTCASANPSVTKALAGCRRSRASFDVYKARRHAAARSARGSRESDAAP